HLDSTTGLVGDARDRQTSRAVGEIAAIGRWWARDRGRDDGDLGQQFKVAEESIGADAHIHLTLDREHPGERFRVAHLGYLVPERGLWLADGEDHPMTGDLSAPLLQNGGKAAPTGRGVFGRGKRHYKNGRSDKDSLRESHDDSPV